MSANVPVVLLALAMFALGASPVRSENTTEARDRTQDTIDLEVGSAVSINFPEAVRTVVVGDEKIATARLVGDRTVVVFPAKIGVTNLLVLNQQADIVGEFKLPVSPPATVSLWQWGDPMRIWCTEEKCITASAVKEDNYKREVVVPPASTSTTNVNQQTAPAGGGGAN